MASCVHTLLTTWRRQQASVRSSRHPSHCRDASPRCHLRRNPQIQLHQPPQNLPPRLGRHRVPRLPPLVLGEPLRRLQVLPPVAGEDGAVHFLVQLPQALDVFAPAHRRWKRLYVFVSPSRRASITCRPCSWHSAPAPSLTAGAGRWAPRGVRRRMHRWSAEPTAWIGRPPISAAKIPGAAERPRVPPHARWYARLPRSCSWSARQWRRHRW